MRHKKKRATQIAAWAQKRSLIIRNLITNLVTHWAIQTTSKRAKALQATADSFFAKLIRCYSMYSEWDVRREQIRRVKEVITTDDAWVKLVDTMLPKWNEDDRSFWFVQTLKLWNRAGDNAQKVLVRIQ
jgi:ribosomal protein L17